MNSAPARHPTAHARMALAARFGLTYSSDMQDWEWEVADSQRFQEFLTTYRSSQLSDEERYSLMEILVQCVENMGLPSQATIAWSELEPLLMGAAQLHGATIEYWSCRAATSPECQFKVSPLMRKVYASTRQVRQH